MSDTVDSVDILVVDDDENILEVFTDVLEADGFGVLVAQNGYEALKLAEEQDFPVTITDLRLPGTDGLELLRRFRESNYSSCVIVMTAYGSKEDIAILAAFFLGKFRRQAKREIERISPEALALMSQYDWPGNVRELENAIERAVVLSRDIVITPHVLPEAVCKSRHKESKSYSLRENEERLILKALAATNWEIKKAAQLLGISRPTLYSKMEKHKIKAIHRGNATRRKRGCVDRENDRRGEGEQFAVSPCPRVSPS